MPNGKRSRDKQPNTEMITLLLPKWAKENLLILSQETDTTMTEIIITSLKYLFRKGPVLEILQDAKGENIDELKALFGDNYND